MQEDIQSMPIAQNISRRGGKIKSEKDTTVQSSFVDEIFIYLIKFH